jgi:hypothetical protein
MKKLASIVVVSGVFMAAMPALAAPVYLECQLIQNSEGSTPAEHPWNWQITVNEAEGRVDFAHPAAADRTSAVFTADAVRWSNDSRYLSTTFLIDRTNLRITRSLTIGGDVKVSHGQCRVVRASERAF